MFKNNKNLLVIAVIAIVNALGYGIIIPVLYTYSQKFGLTDFQNGLLFSVYSVGQFIATPIIGRLSDKFGRKPLLLISLFGTFLSFLLMAIAFNGWMLFFARALDGITAGNIPVASAVISDTTAPKDRAKGFGIIGAAFGFGFIFGPVISAFASPYGLSLPFWIAAIVTLISVILTWIILPETNINKKEIIKGKLIDFKKLFTSVTDPNVGTTLLVSLLYSLAFSLYIYAFQPFAVKTLGMNVSMIALNFTAIGVVGLIAQGFVIPKVIKLWGEKQLLIYSFIATTITFIILFLAKHLWLFLTISIIHAFFNSFISPLIQTMLSKEMDEKSQGSILGLNASYISIGTIFGPIIGGAITTLSIELPFLSAAVVVFTCFILSREILKKHLAKQHAF
ncbi:MAG: Major facilitator superfamily transporter [Candidatus Gottesmanbacteria bacterium GW2011_GWA1_34_13]|uniref:Major facilitator superfamily transporter n=1 Tax=Candidatus Gottesmanbacteria bacterium GW2011_GWA1_34_13 TaxID=1618434 RepID=A0A0G0AR28_9BACT|nr:MAG: Major facilitator superfamily transporter [Candidatus Gottesmanbacteria bacterium GW2011_GWA1_34_13]